MYIKNSDDFRKIWEQHEKTFKKSFDNMGEFIQKFVKDENPFKFEEICSTFGSNFPKIDVWNTTGRIDVIADIPGYKKEQVSIEFYNNTLTIKGKTRASSTERNHYENGNYVVSELKRSSFSRVITLPKGEYYPDKISAKIEDGVLTVSIPKKEIEENKPKSFNIEIK
jgi:HSP20 family protein